MTAASPARPLFGWLVAAQAAHSVEEYAGRLWESFPPARYLTGIVSSDLEVGFLIINVGLVAFGVWCMFWPVRRGWPAAVPLLWFWVAIQTINGLGHPLWSVMQGGYTPGVLTAVPLLVLALRLGRELTRREAAEPRAPV
ncbi:MAG TPA: HXXEE domain-containing protein [Gemmatimonadaceae bacterium]|nr:HXXEE domain-containing protein [Gemmatimonadaceae bacterium]